jgi:hypothetical protein
VFTADPESVLSPPDFELPCSKKPTKKCSNGYLGNYPKNNLSPHKRLVLQKSIQDSSQTISKSPEKKKSFLTLQMGI